MLRIAFSPSAAFLLIFPTVGYYTLATYSNFLSESDSNSGGTLIRAGSLFVLLIAWVRVPREQRNRFQGMLLPATLFILLYSYRLLENMWFEGMDIAPGNTLILLIFFLSGVVPAFILASMQRALRDEDMIALLSVFSVLFIVGIWFNRDLLMQSASERRMMLDKVNPIALAYVASSFIIFYLLGVNRSKRAVIEAIVFVPVLLMVVALARSRGMMISTGLAIVVYVLVIKGTRRLWTLGGLLAAAVVVVAYADSQYIEQVTDALNRLDPNTDMSTAGHLLAFQGAWNQFLTDPLFGRYAIELVTGYYPHNIYLESLMSVGIVGTIPFIVHLALASFASFRIIRERNGSFTQNFIALLFIRDAIGAAGSGGVWSVSGFWVTSFVVIMMWHGRRRGRPIQIQQRVDRA